MSWFIGLLSLLIFILLLFKYPKKTFIALGVILLCIGLLFYYFGYLPDYRQNKLNSQVDLFVFYDTMACTSEYPLSIICSNNSSRSLDKIQWNINVYRPGYSTNISGYDNDYSYDKIVAPGKGWSICCHLPLSMELEGIDPSKLEYKISYKYVVFSK